PVAGGWGPYPGSTGMLSHHRDPPEECLEDDLVSRHLAGAATEAESQRVVAHIQICPSCRRLVAHLLKTRRPGPGATIGRYQLVAPLGAGAMGQVYVALDPALDRRVAVKLVSQALLAGDPERLAERLVAEARVMARLAHPNVVAVHDVGCANEIPFIAMDLV